MDGVPWLRRKIGEGPDKSAQDALHQHAKGIYLDRLKEKNKYIKLAWSCCGGMGVIAAIAVGGSIYLGTLPKSDVEVQTLDPMGYSLAMYTKDVLAASEKDAMRVLLLERFVRGIRETYPNDKEKHQTAIIGAQSMAPQGSLAFDAGVKLFQKTKPYERAKKERVTLSEFATNRVGSNTWHLQFKESVQGITTHTTPIDKTCTAVITTETRNDIESKRQTPLGFFVIDLSFDAGCS